MRLASQRIQVLDVGGAKEILDKVKAKNPEQQYLWASYGAIASIERNDDEAAADFRREISLHPDDPNAVGGLAAVQMKAGDSLGARQTLRQYLDQIGRAHV